jgi:uncharacterized repeat protein (TIGR01451 family)
MFIVLLSSPVMAYTLDDIEWSDSTAKTGTLKWGGTLTLDDYTIKAEDFNEDGYVSLGIYRDGVLEKKSPARAGEGIEFRDTEKGDDLRILIKTVTLNIDEWTGNMDDPSAAIEIYERGIPEMDIVITTESDEYDPRMSTYRSIIATIDIDNEGDAEAEDLIVEIDTGGMKFLDGEDSYHFTSVEEDEVLDQIEIELEIPEYWDETDVDITVTTKSEDINGEIHEDTETETITIEPVVELIVTKTVTEEIYMDETAHVSVSIWNNGIYSLSSVTLTNPQTSDLEIQDNVESEVTLSIGSKETEAKIFEYTLKPTKTGTFTIPAASATFTDPDGNTHTFKSDTTKMEIDGPDIVLTKTVSPESVSPGDEVTVKVTVKNQGTKDASVTTTETMPENATYVSGDLSFHDVAAHGKSYTYSYILKVEGTGDIKVPETTATFIDLEDYKGEKVSNMPLITVVDPSEVTTESSSSSSSSTSSSSSGTEQSSSDDNYAYTYEEDTDRVEPGFEASFMMLALFAVYFVSKRRDR